LLLAKPQQLLPTFAAQNARDPWPEIQHVEPTEPQKHLSLHALDVSDYPIVKPFTEAHEHEQGEHGVLKMVNDFY